jgi:hypothetical protein
MSAQAAGGRAAAGNALHRFRRRLQGAGVTRADAAAFSLALDFIRWSGSKQLEQSVMFAGAKGLQAAIWPLTFR